MIDATYLIKYFEAIVSFPVAAERERERERERAVLSGPICDSGGNNSVVSDTGEV